MKTYHLLCTTILFVLHACSTDNNNSDENNNGFSDSVLTKRNEAQIIETDSSTTPLNSISRASLNKGIGLIRGNFIQYNIDRNRKHTSNTRSLPIYDSTLTTIIGKIPVISEKIYTYRAYVVTETDTIRYFSCNHDRPSGMFNWENSIHVYDINGDFYNLFVCRYGVGKTWANKADADSLFEFYSWLSYFKMHPEGNDGWSHGYYWIGNNDAHLLKNPKDNSEVIEYINGKYEIYLNGEYEGNFALVTIKEVNYNFGELYFENANYGRQYKGWLKIVTDEGFPLIEEVILGC